MRATPPTCRSHVKPPKTGLTTGPGAERYLIFPNGILVRFTPAAEELWSSGTARTNRRHGSEK
eukprot:3649366-Prymnesium_polylepis.1